MFLNTNYITAEHSKYLYSKENIFYVRNKLDTGEHSTTNDEEFDLAQFATQITQHNLLALIAMMKSFRLTGGKIKCERLIKCNKLIYNISIKGYFFAEIDCENRAINKITDEFNFDANKNEKFKEEVIQIANFIKENVFINHKPNDMTMQLISPLNELQDYKKWLEYMESNNKANRYLSNTFEIPEEVKKNAITIDNFDLIMTNITTNKTEIKRLEIKEIKNIVFDKIGYKINYNRGLGRYIYNSLNILKELKKSTGKCLNNNDDFMKWLAANFVKKETNGCVIFTRNS